MDKLPIDVWSDIACPWCYVGKRRLAAALARFPRRDQLDITWRSFELDPSAPRVLAADVPYSARLARKFGTSASQAAAMLDRMTAVAAADGLELRFDRIRPGNTFDAHRLLHLARAHGLQDELKERLLRAYFSEGEPIGDPAALARIAPEVGLDPRAVRRVLDGDDHADDVRADEDEARRLGVRGVPFFVFAGRHAVSGAQPPDALLAALTTAWSELSADTFVEGSVCGLEGCL